eukprot:CAMPEP_0179148234 /NCGR_PEP_ID=MMETSP0796-20121207/71718_1 /TAXON_ID=73915 /ORGANISM="Pyrodinium bahamense, Strain pbaha01" /LENGTH=62 /DNA_ID=CAMNT_0020848925 /DNA_START=17 /DNA_END=201 /DNA_ORIENTATION=+
MNKPSAMAANCTSALKSQWANSQQRHVLSAVLYSGEIGKFDEVCTGSSKGKLHALASICTPV